ncbi:MAG: TolC family protein [Phaeodactylibacter sp.]|nr:TolC family protein [Phaeodactylibacter sp.]
MIHRSLVVFFLFFGGLLSAQTTLLDQYISTALESNIALRQQELSYAKSLATLKEAKALFFPTLSLEARYSRATGGRVIEIPVGDLMNPVYANLNLLNSIGAATSPDYPNIPEYPVIENSQENFLRSEEHETKLRLIQPVFNAAILQNHQIRKDLNEAERISVDIYKRSLVQEVKEGYFKYMQAVEAEKLYLETLALVEENLRTTESLFKYHKVTKDAVYGAEAQVKEVEQELAELQASKYLAQAYFNFLLNRPTEAEIEQTDLELPVVPEGLEAMRLNAQAQREELAQLNAYMLAANDKVNLQKGNYLPTVNLVGDYGFQGTEYSFTSEDDFAMGSLVLSWKLFDHSTSAKVQQARIEQDQLQQKKLEVERQLDLQVIQAYYELDAARKRIDLAAAQERAAQEAFKLVRKQYDQGQTNLVSFTDARTRLTNAQQQAIIANYDYLIRHAKLERATATYNF